MQVVQWNLWWLLLDNLMLMLLCPQCLHLFFVDQTVLDQALVEPNFLVYARTDHPGRPHFGPQDMSFIQHDGQAGSSIEQPMTQPFALEQKTQVGRQWDQIWGGGSKGHEMISMQDRGCLW